MTHQIISAVIAISLVFVVTGQCRKPTWWPGRLFLAIMNRSHAAVTTWGLSHVQIGGRFVAGGFLDVEVFEERSHGWMCATGRKP